MKFEFDLDIQGIVAKATSPENIQPILDKAITKALTESIDSATGYNSEFRVKLKAQLSEALPHGLALDEVVKFQHLLNTAVTSALQGANLDTINAAMAKIAKEVLPELPPTIKLSELVATARESFHKDPEDSFYAYFEPSEYGGGGHLYLDQNARPGSSSRYGDRGDWKYSANHSIAFNKEGEAYSIKFDGENLTPKSRPTVITELESMLLALYTGRTTIEVDIDGNAVESASGEQYD